MSEYSGGLSKMNHNAHFIPIKNDYINIVASMPLLKISV